MKWFDLLEAARELPEPFTAPDLSRGARIKPAKTSSPDKIASGWISKFCKWGYAERLGSKPSGTGSWVRLFKLTESGKSLSFKPGKVATLAEAVRSFVDSQKVMKGKKFEAMVSALEEFENRFNR